MVLNVSLESGGRVQKKRTVGKFKKDFNWKRLHMRATVHSP